jgi:hypothetical protein
VDANLTSHVAKVEHRGKFENQLFAVHRYGGKWIPKGGQTTKLNFKCFQLFTAFYPMEIE